MLTKVEVNKLALAIKAVADAPGADKLTVRAITQKINAMLWESGNGRYATGFQAHATGVIDLSGTDYVAKLGER